MSCIRHPIESRDRPFEVDPARFDHFELGAGEPISDEVVVRDPSWTLYATDPDHDRAMLVQLPDGVDLTAYPFAFVAQFDHAVAAVELPMTRLIELAKALPRPAKLVYLFNVGRCGSTLTSRILREVDAVWSLSEPDAFGQLVPRRHEYGTERMQRMLGAASLWSYRPSEARADQTCVLKLRSEALFDVFDYVRAIPESTSLFVYRDLAGWADSAHRFSQRHGVDVAPGSTSMRDLIWPVLSANAPAESVADICDPSDPATPIELAYAALWTIRMEAYDHAARTGVDFHPFSYARLDGERDTTVAALLGVLGHDDPDAVHRASRAYDADSQQGTAGARDRHAQPLDDHQRRRLRTLARENERVRAAVELLP